MPFSSTDPWLMPLLRTIAGRPGMFLGSEDVRALDVYLLGYQQARHDLGVPDLLSDERVLWEHFNSWLVSRTGGSASLRWPTLVERIDPSSRNLRTFFRLLEEFLATRGQSLSDISSPSWPPDPDLPC